MTATDLAPINSGWPKPDLAFLIADEHSDVPLFPVAKLGPFWAEFVSDAAEGLIPRDYFATALLGTAAGLIGNACEAQMPNRSMTQPATLWTVLVGHPGARKSPALKPFVSMVAEIEARQMQRRKFDDATIAGVLRIIRSTGEPGLLLMNHELSGWWSTFRIDRQGEQFWLKAWDGDEQYTVDRGNADPFVIDRLNISVVGGAQPATLGTMLAATGNVEKGFVARCMMSFPNSPPKGQDWSGKKADFDTARDQLARIAGLFSGRTRSIPVTASAAAFHKSWNERVKVDYWLDPTAPEGQWLIKQYGTCIRIALVLEHLWWATRKAPDAEVFRKAQAIAALAGRQNDNGPQRQLAERMLRKLCAKHELDDADVKAGILPSGPDPSGPSEVGLRAMKAACHLIEHYFLPHFERGQSFAYAATDMTAAVALCRKLVVADIRQFNAKDLRQYKFGKIHPLLHGNKASTVVNDVCAFLEMRHVIRHVSPPPGKVGRKPVDYEVNPLLAVIARRVLKRRSP